jgi:hypothetical protein
MIVGNGEFVATGSPEGILTSTNGLDWTPQWSGVAEGLRSLAFGQGRFVGVGGNFDRIIVSSEDGARWTVRRLSLETELNQVVFGGSLFVAVGGAILTSYDGTLWNPVDAHDQNHLTGVAYGNDRFVAVGYDGELLTSKDGNSWTSAPLPLSGAYPIIIFDGQQFVIAGDEDRVWVSPDGNTWTPHSTGVLKGVTALTYGGGQYVAVGGQGFVATSTNAINWTSHSDGLSLLFERVAAANGQYLVSAIGQLIGTSDGANWSGRGALPSFLTVGLDYVNGYFIAAGRDNAQPLPAFVQISTDGTNWERHDLGSTTAPESITYGGGQYVAVGGAIFSSPNAKDWTVRVPTIQAELSGVAFGNGRFVAVGPETDVWTSQNGAGWAPHSAGTNVLTDVTFGNGLFVAVGGGVSRQGNGASYSAHDRILTSTDGEQWIEQTVPVDPNRGVVYLTSITYGAGWFVAVGGQGAILTSPDGNHWKARESGAFANLNSISFSTGRFVAVGDAGTMLLSDAIPVTALDRATFTPSRFQFHVGGSPGQRLSIEATDGLPASWRQIGTVTNAVDGATFIDSTVSNSPARFYRAIE